MVKTVLTVCLFVASIAWIGFTQTQQQEGIDSQSSSQSTPDSRSQSLEQSQSAFESQMQMDQTNGQMTNGQTQMGSKMTQVDPLIGQKVMDSQQQEIGQIQDVIVDTQSKQAKYAVLGSGGFLGIGEDYHAVPWSALKIQSVQDRIQSVTISTDAETIKNSPVVQIGTNRTFDSSLQSQIDSYYQGKGIGQQTNGASQQMDGMTNGASRQQDSSVYQPSTSGTRPSGMSGTSTQDRQFNTAEPDRESIIPESDGTNGMYGDGVRSGQERQDIDITADPNATSSMQSYPSNGQTNGTSSASQQTGKTSTQYRSGYADGVNRSPVTSETNGTYSDSASTRDSSLKSDSAAATNGQAVQAADSQFLFFSDLSGRQVKGMQDEQIGSLEDLVVDSQKGNIAFGLVNMDDGMVAIPWNAIQTKQDSLIVNAEKETLRSLAFQSNNKPNFNDPAYQRQVYQQFGQQPPTVYGYVAPSGAIDLESDYTQKFDSQKIETVSGEIKEIMKDTKQERKLEQQKQQQSQGQGQSQGQSSMSKPQSQQPSQHLKIETEQGQTLDVHAAPKHFLKQQNMELKKGDRIEVTGSRVQMEGKDVLIATKISKEGQEVTLRSPQGQPMWQTGQTGSQMQTDQSGYQSGSTGDGMIDSQMNGQSNGASGLSGQSMQFKPEEQTTLSGKVQSTDSGASPLAGTDKAVLFSVQTDQGQTTTVYAGPRDYLEKQNMTFSSGDNIQATGWKKTIGGQEVFIASKIEKDGQTLNLRDSQGTPQWKQEGSSLYKGMESQHQQHMNGSNDNATQTY